MDQTPFPATPAAASADRADAPVSETAERFLRGILQRLPLSRIEELHLFSPLRQGSVETGIAVVAARPEPRPEPHPAVAGAAEAPAAAVAAAVTDAEAPSADAEAPVPDVDVPSVEAEAPVPEVEAPSVDAAAPQVEAAAPAAHDEAPAADADAPPAEAEGALAEGAPLPVAVVAPAAPAPRHEVYTARYRLVLKGPDRGKWEADLVAEADAPLVTVETVVRGVQRRAGEATETVRYGAAQVARALRLPDPAP